VTAARTLRLTSLRRAHSPDVGVDRAGSERLTSLDGDPHGIESRAVAYVARFAFASCCAAFLVPACGDDSVSSGADAGPLDASMDRRGPVGDAADESARTGAGSTYETCSAPSDASAPDGGCNSARIVLVHPAGAPCTSVGVGTFCNRLMFAFNGLDAAAVPAGFVCDHELGVSTCTWGTPDGGALTLDSFAFNGACAATISFPGTEVECIVY
jgi:hypothetical protein